MVHCLANVGVVEEVMNLTRALIGTAAVVCSGLSGIHLAWGHADASNMESKTKDRAHTLISQALPALDGGHLKATLLEVRYGPGEASPPHSHPCAVIAYVVEGSLRTQVQGQPEMTYEAGQSFYEAPHGVHLVSANASSTESATFVAYMICDHDTPLNLDVPEHESQRGGTR